MRSSRVQRVVALSLPSLSSPSLGLAKRCAIALCVSLPLALMSGCGGSDEEPVCELSAEGQLTFTQVDLESSLSSSLCPEVTPEALSTAGSPAGEEGCSQRVQDCQLIVECSVEGIVAEGALQMDDDVLFGRVQISEPLACSYQVEATQE